METVARTSNKGNPTKKGGCSLNRAVAQRVKRHNPGWLLAHPCSDRVPAVWTGGYSLNPTDRETMVICGGG